MAVRPREARNPPRPARDPDRGTRYAWSPARPVVDLQQFDLNLLVALDALLTDKSVTRAGARMNLSQSAMSGTLARLRDVFHDELLVPVGRGMVLTPLAQE